MIKRIIEADNVAVLANEIHPWNVDMRDENGNTALRHASLWASHNCVEFLISIGADVNAQNLQKRTSLHALCSVYMVGLSTNRMVKAIQILRMLCRSSKIQIDPVDAHRCTPLTNAINMNHWDMAKVLLDHGADIRLAMNFMEYSSSTYANLINLIGTHRGAIWCTILIWRFGDSPLRLLPKDILKIIIQDLQSSLSSWIVV
jgi:ankyrin repeat protein